MFIKEFFNTHPIACCFLFILYCAVCCYIIAIDGRRLYRRLFTLLRRRYGKDRDQ